MTQREPSAAAALYPHLPQGAAESVRRRSELSVADAMWPSLSQAAKTKQAAQVRQDAEMKERSKRTAENLQAVIDSLRREKGRR